MPDISGLASWLTESVVNCIPYLVFNMIGGQVGQLIRDWWRS